MSGRLLGIETEYALTGLDPDGAPLSHDAVLGPLMRLASARLPHLPDAGGRGMFLGNGARFYIDAGNHPEFSTPECPNPWDVVRYVRAGERMLTELAAALTASERRIGELVVLRCNVDYGGTSSTWGCHSSILHRADPAALPRHLIPHLASRVIYTGAGGFNSHFLRGIQFTLSPRVWHLEHVVSDQSTCARGIFHTKDETLSSRGYHRLHILCGESLCSETAAWLSIGATALIVALVEGGLRPGDGVQLQSPLEAMQRFASDPTCRARASLEDGKDASALAIQHHYLRLAEERADAPFMPAWAAEVCRRWRTMLEQLDHAPQSVSTVVDWAIKLALYKDRARRHGISWEALPHWNHVVTALGAALERVRHPDPRPPVELILHKRGPVADEVKRLTPCLREHGLQWDELHAFTRLRDELFEIDARFGQLGEKSIFAALDRARVLVHHVDGVDNIEHALEQPPASGRARVRGAYVRELAGTTSRYLCDWSSVWDCEGQRRLDLSNPFAITTEWEKWGPDRADASAIRSRLREILRP